jgi:hypothetical protein
LESRSEIFTINPTVFKEVVRDIYILGEGYIPRAGVLGKGVSQVIR